jgi:hypothetical protein
MRREEVLRLGRGLESLHLSLSSSGGSMRILSATIQIAVLSVPVVWQPRAMRDAISDRAMSECFRRARFMTRETTAPLGDHLKVNLRT